MPQLKQYQFDEAKCRELFNSQHQPNGCAKITVHINKDPEAYWNGIPVYHHGQWNEENLGIVRNYVNPEPVLVRFGAISSQQCSKEV